MKRITIIIMALLCGAFLFAADTGYGRNQWYSGVSEVSTNTKIYKRFITSYELDKYLNDNNMTDLFYFGFLNEYEYTKSMVGEETKVYYQFTTNEKLDCVNYIISLNNVKNLKSKLKNPIREIENIVSLKADTESRTDWLRMGLTAEAREMEQFNDDGLNGMKKDGEPGRVLIYDYNDDTRLYLFENIIKDKAVVVYVPHEQDY